MDGLDHPLLAFTLADTTNRLPSRPKLCFRHAVAAGVEAPNYVIKLAESLGGVLDREARLVLLWSQIA